VLVVPNRHITSMNDLEEEYQETVGYLMRMIRVVARGQGIAESGYRVVVNMGADAMMTVPHLHVHVLGGRKLGWPPG
jgi:histidine triad (HIT) family protein